MKIRVAHGAEVERMPPQIAAIKVNRPSTPGVRLMRVSQTIHISVDVGVSSNGNGCDICHADMPEPTGDEALEFLLRNADNGRLVFPYEEGVADERDCYPCEGWVYHDETRVCPECSAELKAHMEQMRAEKQES